MPHGARRDGKFLFDFNILPGYPHDAPKVKCKTKVSTQPGAPLLRPHRCCWVRRPSSGPPPPAPCSPATRPQVYHPNIDLEGNICLNILREDWKPVLSISSVVYGLQFLFLVGPARPCCRCRCCSPWSGSMPLLPAAAAQALAAAHAVCGRSAACKAQQRAHPWRLPRCHPATSVSPASPRRRPDRPPSAPWRMVPDKPTRTPLAPPRSLRPLPPPPAPAPAPAPTRRTPTRTTPSTRRRPRCSRTAQGSLSSWCTGPYTAAPTSRATTSRHAPSSRGEGAGQAAFCAFGEGETEGRGQLALPALARCAGRGWARRAQRPGAAQQPAGGSCLGHAAKCLGRQDGGQRECLGIACGASAAGI
jgi:hypothetical protein